MADSAADKHIAARLAVCKPFLREDFESIDPRLPGLLKILQQRGAGECWHKHGTFYEHLLHTYRILKVWGCSDVIALFGLFHSSYSNSYVNLAIFAPDVDRDVVRGLLGDEAEALVHLFCVVPRQQVIFDNLMHKLTDDELATGLAQYDDQDENSKKSSVVTEAGAKGAHDKMKLFIPEGGMVVQHIRTGEDIVLHRRLVALFLLLTMADFIDQWYGWQDELFKNYDGEFKYSGNEFHALWPGHCKPGLWLTSISRMGVLLNILLKEDAAEKVRTGGTKAPFHDLEIPLPNIFETCSVIFPAADQVRSRDLYWEGIHYIERERLTNTALPLLKTACELNPFAAEPFLTMAQIYLNEDEFGLAEVVATKGLTLLLDWGTNWDKRMTWEGWVSFARILRNKSAEKVWPKTSFGILNLGLVE